MRLAGIFAVFVLLAGSVLLYLKRSLHPVWAKEPDRLLGIQFGRPLTDSLPPCKGDDDTRMCVDLHYGYWVNNLPSPLRTARITEGPEGVTMISSAFQLDAEDLVKRDLRERYGKPQSTSGDHWFWDGKRVSLSVGSADGHGYLIASMHPVGASPLSPYKNPF